MHPKVQAPFPIWLNCRAATHSAISMVVLVRYSSHPSLSLDSSAQPIAATGGGWAPSPLASLCFASLLNPSLFCRWQGRGYGALVASLWGRNTSEMFAAVKKLNPNRRMHPKVQDPFPIWLNCRAATPPLASLCFASLLHPSLFCRWQGRGYGALVAPCGGETPLKMFAAVK